MIRGPAPSNRASATHFQRMLQVRQVKTRILNSPEPGQLEQDQAIGLFSEELNTSGL